MPRKSAKTTAAAATTAQPDSIPPSFVEGYKKALKNHARCIFDYLTETGAAGATFSEIERQLPDGLPLTVCEAVVEYLEDKSLVNFSASSQRYSIMPGAEWLETFGEPTTANELQTTKTRGSLEQSETDDLADEQAVFDLLSEKGALSNSEIQSSLKFENNYAVIRTCQRLEDKGKVEHSEPAASGEPRWQIVSATAADQNINGNGSAVAVENVEHSSNEKLAKLEAALTEARKKQNDALFAYLTNGETTELSLVYSRALEKSVAAGVALGNFLRSLGRDGHTNYLPIETEEEVRRRAKEVLNGSAVAVRIDESLSNGNGKSYGDEFRFVAVAELVPSATVPQSERRKRMSDASLDELANSIQNQGVLEPLIVRPLPKRHDGQKFEIVCGERRWLASQKAGLTAVQVIVRNLSDEQVLQVQLDENLHRQDVHPLDEAVWYEHLQETLKLKVAELALRVGKPEKHVLNRLKLNDLIDEARNLLAADQLPIGHALEIAKFSPENQSRILPKAFENYWQNGEYQPDRTRPVTISAFRRQIKSDILLDLSEAPFSTKAKDLRADGLACVKCPERTGARGVLFEEYYEKGDDRCLNARCFETKIKNHILKERATLSEKAAAFGKSADYRAPLLCWIESKSAETEAFYGESLLFGGDFQASGAGECEFTETGIYVDRGWRFGKTIEICRTIECKKHFRSGKPDSSSSSNSGQSERDRLKRKQEIFDVKVGEAVRRKVLTEAAESFSDEKWVFDDAEWRLRLAIRLWTRIDENARAAITEALGKPKHGIETYFGTEKEGLRYFTEELTLSEVSRILFLSIIANCGEMLYGNWVDQKRVQEIAAEFGVDYLKLDAGERLTKSPKKYFPLAQEYFNAVERGENPAKPIFYKPEPEAKAK